LAAGLAAFHAAASERLSPKGDTDAAPLRNDVADSA
ncbi:MarR family transcriptional regulator, partial [Streptomyces sp. NPDC059346]